MNLRPSNDAVDVRYVFTRGAGAETYAQLLTRLPAGEQARARSYLLLEDRLAFSVGRVLLRTLLSQCASEPAGGWRLMQNTYGKPSIEPAPGTPDIRFSLSHCRGAVVAAFALGRDVGVDVEPVEDHPGLLEVARARFSAAETELLESLSRDGQRDAFFALWTLKEAWGKARGTGLAVPLPQFAFSLDTPAISLAAPDAVDSALWFFRQHRLPPVHQIAIAARRSPEEQPMYREEETCLSQLLRDSRLPSRGAADYTSGN